MRLRCSYVGHTFDASRSEGEIGASVAVGAGTVGNWRATTEGSLAHTSRSLALDQGASLSHERLPATTVPRLPPEPSLPLLPDFFPLWLAGLLHPYAARTALR